MMKLQPVATTLGARQRWHMSSNGQVWRHKPDPAQTRNLIHAKRYPKPRKAKADPKAKAKPGCTQGVLDLGRRGLLTRMLESAFDSSDPSSHV